MQPKTTIDYQLTGIDQEGNLLIEIPLTAQDAGEIILAAITSGRVKAIVESVENASSEIILPPKDQNKNRAGDGDERRRIGIVRDLSANILKPRQIAEKYGCDIQTVYNIKSQETRTGVLGDGRKERCSECGTTGSRHFKTCSKSKSKMVDVLPAKPTVQLTADQYETLRSAMHDREFQSGKYSLVNGLSPTEVNIAVRSSSYDEYLALRF